MSYPEWEASQEYEDWIQSGGRDEEFDYYYNKWAKRYYKS